ncbi:WG repeat-containing protein [Chryseobacterium sp. C-2]|uniref:WG repeat-containing protein n=1 Tax=Chryseobacterium muglaense TaxID=2893752 RepID=A0ABR8M6C9_9FLAO|nr:WG repeat-containing protein [Chryseobacterium muglaense]
MILRKLTLSFLILCSVFAFSQSKSLKKSNLIKSKNTVKSNIDKNAITTLPVVNEELPLLIPQKKNGKSGFVNQKGKFVIQPEYDLVMFFGEDCNLLNSPNEKIRKFGTSDFATVEKNKIAFRINKSGKKVYQYKDADLGKCILELKKALFHAYILKGKYGIIEDSKFKNPSDQSQFTIYPKYQYLYILEGDDVSNPMIVAAYNDKFGVIDVNNKIIIPFEYADIKRNYSWKLGKMFEVTKDDKNYYYIDSYNQSY